MSAESEVAVLKSGRQVRLHGTRRLTHELWLRFGRRFPRAHAAARQGLSVAWDVATEAGQETLGRVHADLRYRPHEVLATGLRTHVEATLVQAAQGAVGRRAGRLRTGR